MQAFIYAIWFLVSTLKNILKNQYYFQNSDKRWLIHAFTFGSWSNSKKRSSGLLPRTLRAGPLKSPGPSSCVVAFHRLLGSFKARVPRNRLLWALGDVGQGRAEGGSGALTALGFCSSVVSMSRKIVNPPYRCLGLQLILRWSGGNSFQKTH